MPQGQEAVGVALVNAPIAPDAIYLGRAGSHAGISVLDLNGWGAGSGSPRFDPTGSMYPQGWSFYPLNPNVRLQGSLMIPPLQPGSSNADGGSSGVFSLTRDAALSSVLTDTTRVRSVSDLMLGHSLDAVFSDGTDAGGCQAGGGNPCADRALKILDVAIAGPNTLQPTGPGDTSIHLVVGAENPISVAPHPNPPALAAPPTCLIPLIAGEEPTSREVIANGLTNLLVPGDPIGDPAMGIPPSGLLTPEQNIWFVGPSPVGTPPLECEPYMFRQQVGHFLYVADRAADAIVVLDSNQMRVLGHIPLADPTRLAMGPNLDFLAVTSRASGTVSFVDIDPASPTFHEIVHVTPVGSEPCGIAWDPGNEDVLVCNEGDDSLSILSASSLSVRKTVTRTLSDPFDVVVTPRQADFGFQRNVYYAYVLNRDGSVFESGPSGVNGWGYDDVLGRVPFLFRSPRAIQPDPIDLRSGVWIAHEGPIDVQTGQPGPPGIGAVSRLVFESGLVGEIPLVPGSTAHFRDMTFRVTPSIGEPELSGIPIDLAFDDQRNLGALPNVPNPFSAGTPVRVNGKGTIRAVGGAVRNTSTPQLLFVAVPGSTGAGSDVVDVIDLATLQRVDADPWQSGVDSIAAPGVRVLMGYFRQ